LPKGHENPADEAACSVLAATVRKVMFKIASGLQSAKRNPPLLYPR
jgi:hypothetical protein